ncbi:aminopeptidase N [Boudabousia tangfeifanii]|uniref:Aminopeptidase N n=1 Tax=Boudabousia tangfeifanii TaxID=1912795 RepID=A0A1D9MKD7_9ACTO|nr:aminopeptidase N [Boudabousia tangfeifanii]AOZ72643.1 aminopeptidase N [Boudabousia tangfeifanii]
MTLTRIEAKQRSASLKIDNYQIDLDLSGAKTEKTFRSVSTVEFSSSDVATFIDLVAERINSIELNGEQVDPTYEDGKIFLENLKADEANTLTIDAQCWYSRTGEGLHRFIDEADNNKHYLYTQYEPFDAHRVYACFDQPDLKAVWNFQITAPTGWVVLSNGVETSAVEKGKVTTRSFAPTKPLSSYITCVIAGEYAKVPGGTWTREAQGEIPAQAIDLALYCRQSLLPDFDTDDVFKVTRQGFDFFAEHYQYPYPWGKYDQVYVPEYNLGAMENPGCVTFNERFIVSGGPSWNQRGGRANTTLHEMCHMWFGDLVTPAWWDDLWLKESFADHQGTFAQGAATIYQDAWVKFAIARKGWAYIQDQYPTTHPIMADIVDLDAAKQNFDGITYAKGAAVLKQLVRYVGEDNFFAGARNYFEANAFGATSFVDLISALESVCEKDLQSWVDSWLKTTGPSVISAEVEDSQESVDVVTFHQENAQDPQVVRPHRFTLARYQEDQGKLVLLDQTDVTLESETLAIELPKANGKCLLVPNADDATYAVIRLDASSREMALKHVSEVPDDLVRAVIWQALWMEVRDGLMPAADFVSAVISQLPNESADVLAETTLHQAQTAISSYVPGSKTRQLAVALAKLAQTQVEQASTLDRQRAWAEIFAGILPFTEDDFTQTQIDHLLQNDVMTKQHKWDLLTGGAAAGIYSAEDISQRADFDSSSSARVEKDRALAAVPDLVTKEQFWNKVITEEVSNEYLTRVLSGLNQSAQSNLLTPWIEKFFETALPFWQDNTIGMGTRFISAAAPHAPRLLPGQEPSEHPVVLKCEKWLVDNPQAPHALRRLLTELHDDLLRALRAQANA